MDISADKWCPYHTGEENVSPIFNPLPVPDLNGQTELRKLSQEIISSKTELGDVHPPKELCKPIQPDEVGTKSSSCKMLPGKVPNIQDTHKTSELVSTGLHIETQVVSRGYKTDIKHHSSISREK